MKTTQSLKIQKATQALGEALKGSLATRYRKTQVTYAPPLDRNHLGKDLVFSHFGGRLVDRTQEKVLFDLVTKDGFKILAVTSSLHASRTRYRPSLNANCGNLLYPASYLGEDKLPDFVILTVINHLKASVDLFQFPLIKDDGEVRKSVSVSYSVLKGNYGKNESFKIASFPI
jgi:hypothetical protein